MPGQSLGDFIRHKKLYFRVNVNYNGMSREKYTLFDNHNRSSYRLSIICSVTNVDECFNKDDNKQAEGELVATYFLNLFQHRFTMVYACLNIVKLIDRETVRIICRQNCPPLNG